MNRKQFTILLVLVVVLGVAGVMVYRKQNESTGATDASVGKKAIGELAINDVAQITISQGTNRVDLAKKEDLWRVAERNGYPANYSEISDFLIKLKDLKVVQSEQVGASQLPKLWLTPGEGSNTATVVEFKDQGGKVMKTILLGKKHMKKSNRPMPSAFGGDMGDEGWPDGRYLLVGSSKTVALVSDALANAEPKPEQWLSKDFFKIEKPKSISVTFPTATNSWKLTRETETGEWKLADAKPEEKLDTAKISPVTNPFSSPSFNDVLSNAKPEELGLDKGTNITIETFENFTYHIKVGAKTNDNYALTVSVAAQLPTERTPGKDEKAEDKDKLDKEFKEKQKKLEEKLTQEKSFEKWIYLVSSWTVDSLLKERSQLLVEKKDEKKPGDANGGSTSTNAAPASADESDKLPMGLGTGDDKEEQ